MLEFRTFVGMVHMPSTKASLLSLSINSNDIYAFELGITVHIIHLAARHRIREVTI